MIIGERFQPIRYSWNKCSFNSVKLDSWVVPLYHDSWAVPLYQCNYYYYYCYYYYYYYYYYYCCYYYYYKIMFSVVCCATWWKRLTQWPGYQSSAHSRILAQYALTVSCVRHRVILCLLFPPFPAISLGFTIWDEIFAYMTAFWSSHWGSPILSLCMVHAGCVFVASIHPSRT